MKLADGERPPEWSAFRQAAFDEREAQLRLNTARRNTNTAILRARHSGRITVQEMAEVLNVAESTVRNREKQARK